MCQSENFRLNYQSFCDYTAFIKNLNFVKKGKGQKIADISAAFDIEATSFYDGELKCGLMYAWVFGINGKCVTGRTWEEFTDMIEKIVDMYGLNVNNRLVVYVHNLSYEFQFIKKRFNWYKVFSLDQRKPVYAITDNGIEFRCSYILSGYSLEKLGEQLTKYKVTKKVGDLDYNIIRHPLSKITEKEWGYIISDGLLVMAYIQEEIERCGGLNKLPLTKTGYVRELCREKCLRGDDRFDYVRQMRYLVISAENYQQLKRTFIGGFTHANINYVDSVVECVDSYDFSSSYPAVMLSEKFPMSKPIPVTPKDDEDLKKYLKNFCCMLDIEFYNIRAKVDFENYISKSRCSKIENFYCNNGRVVEADYLRISVTEQDVFIIQDMYKWDSFKISNMNIFIKNYLPKQFILAILELYKAKTELKGVEGKEVEYLVSKGMINSCYGMCVTDPCRDEIIYDGDWSAKNADVHEMIEAYNKNMNRFLYYPWGVWVTAYARRNLFSGILEFKNDYIYSDTDSIKVINADRHKEYLENYNNSIKNKVENCLRHYDIPIDMAYPKTIKGKVKPLGVWDWEGQYSRFKTLGAKRYMTEKDGELAITIAGVSKSAGLRYLKHTFGSNTEVFKNFKEDLYFPPHYDRNGEDDNASGKLLHTYVDVERRGTVIDYMGVAYEFCELSSMHMENTEYSLSLDDDFVRLILGVKESHIT